MIDFLEFPTYFSKFDDLQTLNFFYFLTLDHVFLDFLTTKPNHLISWPKKPLTSWFLHLNAYLFRFDDLHAWNILIFWPQNLFLFL